MKNQTSYSVGVILVDLPKRFDHCNILRNIASAYRGNGYSTSIVGSPLKEIKKSTYVSISSLGFKSSFHAGSAMMVSVSRPP